jgi:RNA polymerase sigma-70 factor, ECF subfamily
MPSPTPIPTPSADRDLVTQAAGGDEKAISALYDRYGEVLYAVAYRIVGQRADAEEVVIEAFAQAWREAPRFEARVRRERITASAAADQPEGSPAMGDWRGDPGSSLEQTERRHQVLLALEILSPPQRKAIELAYFEGLSQSEIAERLQEPLGTIKTRVRLGMQKLRDCLRPFYFERGT